MSIGVYTNVLLRIVQYEEAHRYHYRLLKKMCLVRQRTSVVARNIIAIDLYNISVQINIVI